MVHHLIYSIRLLRKQPGQTLVAVAALALGIGLTTAMFSILQGSFLRGLPLPEADRLMRIDRRGIESEGVRPGEAEVWRGRQSSFEPLVSWLGVRMTFNGDGRPAESLQGAYVSAGFFEAAGVAPILGRTLRPEEDRADAQPVVVLGSEIWASRYGRDPKILGRTVRISGEPTTIVGVMPEGFRFPLLQDYWLPLGRILSPELGRVEVFGKLREGARREQAAQELDVLADRVPPGPGQEIEERRTLVVPFIDGYTEEARRRLWILTGAVVLVLLIACANAASLLLARGALRERELAVRAALGAGRASLVSAVLTEALLLAALGGAAGLALAKAAVDFYNRSGGLVPSYWVDIRLDGGAVAFAGGAVVAAALLAGLVPALRASRVDAGEMLKDRGQGVTSLRVGRLGRVLVGGQVALSCALLVGTGQMIESVRNLQGNDFGAEPENVWATMVMLDPASTPEPADWLRFYEELERRLEERPGVRAAAFASRLPTDRTQRVPVEFEGISLPPGAEPAARWAIASPGYFAALGRPRLEGRDFASSDTLESPRVAIVNRSFAARWFPGESPLGRRIRTGEPDARGSWATIVGVAPDLFLSFDYYAERIDTEHPEGVYFPVAQGPQPGITVLVRTEGPATAMGPEIRRVLAELDPDVAPLYPGTLAERAHGLTADYRMIRGLLTVFGLAALVLAAMGLYGIASSIAGQRRREIAIRRALGAGDGHVLGLVLRGSLLQVGLGALLGLALAMMLSRALGGLLYGLQPGDPSAFVAAAGVLLLVGTAACFAPAWRSVRMDPVEELRGD
ncbi:MAG TPA: ADOP family duplicated permease [Thermoanaerobaculia bacterium]|nr:ADOP family duplicated permease [Thermoanaerobaculia bacterium]